MKKYYKITRTERYSVTVGVKIDTHVKDIEDAIKEAFMSNDDITQWNGSFQSADEDIVELKDEVETIRDFKLSELI